VRDSLLRPERIWKFGVILGVVSILSGIGHGEAPSQTPPAQPGTADSSTPAKASATSENVPQAAGVIGLELIDSCIENGSPLWYEAGPGGTVLVYLQYDLERAAPNRAAGHFHFRVQARPGTELTLELKNLDNVWNGKSGSVAREMEQFVTSEDGQTWESHPTLRPDGERVLLPLKITGTQLDVARIEPYRLSDLDRLLQEISSKPGVQVQTIGNTVEGRPLELIQIGRRDAPFRVFLRARAHPWESGGNWVVQGLIRRLLRNDDHAHKCLERYQVTILPMANKDGVARGRTRFNAQGMDLNRNWNEPADPKLAPENAALETWLLGEIEQHRPPHLAIELHNDGRGLLHFSRPTVPDNDRYLSRMKSLEQLLRIHSWFSEGSTKPSFNNPGTLGDGWLNRFQIDALVHELNANRIARIDQPTSGALWQQYGENLTTVLYEYFGSVKP